MALNSYRLGELITQRREKKPENEELPIRGVSKDGFIPPKQIDADTDIYNVFYKKDFVYNPARMELGSIAFNSDLDKGICSSLYEMFFVHRTDICLPEYLALFVSQDEFARYCNFLSSGSAREYCRFANISQIKISLPSIEEQRKIVHDYKVVKDRIELLKKINVNLEKQAQVLYKSWFVDFDPFGNNLPSNWSEVCISDIASDVVCGKTPSTDDESNFGGKYPFITIPDMHDSVYATKTERTLSDKGISKLLPENSVCVSCIATVGLVSLVATPSQTNQQINSIICKKDVSSFYVYLKMRTLRSELEALGAGGSATLNVSKSLFSQIKMLYPDVETCNKFDNIVKPIFDSIRNNQLEIERLIDFKEALNNSMIKEVA